MIRICNFKLLKNMKIKKIKVAYMEERKKLINKNPDRDAIENDLSILKINLYGIFIEHCECIYTLTQE